MYHQAGSQQAEIFMMRRRQMHGILEYNKRQMMEKQQRKEQEQSETKSYSMRCDQQALDHLLSENQMRTRRKKEEKVRLSEVYQQQISEKAEKGRIQKQRDFLYAQRQEEQRRFQQARRIKQLARMYNRNSYLADHAQQQQSTRVKTENIANQQQPTRIKTEPRAQLQQPTANFQPYLNNSYNGRDNYNSNNSHNSNNNNNSNYNHNSNNNNHNNSRYGLGTSPSKTLQDVKVGLDGAVWPKNFSKAELVKHEDSLDQLGQSWQQKAIQH